MLYPSELPGRSDDQRRNASVLPCTGYSETLFDIGDHFDWGKDSFGLVEPRRIELPTFALRTRRSPS